VAAVLVGERDIQDQGVADGLQIGTVFLQVGLEQPFVQQPLGEAEGEALAAPVGVVKEGVEVARQHLLGIMFEIAPVIFILHKITDVNVVSRLKRSIGGIDEGLWNRLPNLAPGQAIVSMTSMTRPLLVAINPTPCKLRMIE